MLFREDIQWSLTSNWFYPQKIFTVSFHHYELHKENILPQFMPALEGSLTKQRELKGMNDISQLQTVTIREAASNQDMRDAYEIRTRVFVDEQNVPIEEELDAYDELAKHFLAEIAVAEIPLVVGTARLIEKENGVAKIGRVAVLAEYRRQGIGALLMHYIEAYAREQGFSRLILDAQLHALAFYMRLGYIAEGDIFLDAGIEHRFMSKSLLNERVGI